MATAPRGDGGRGSQGRLSVAGRTVVGVGETFALSVPAVLTASFVVVDPQKALRPDVAARVRFEEIPADHPSMARPSALAQGGVPFSELSRLTREPHLLVEMEGRPGWPPRHLFDANVEASALSLMTGGALLDPLLCRFVSTDGPEWADDRPEEFFVPQWVRVMGDKDAEDAGGLLMTTRGLSRLGLPELRTAGLPPYLGLAWARILTVVAFRLLQDLWADLAREPGLTEREIPDEMPIRPYDLAVALDQDPRDSYDAEVRLRPEAGELALLPPRDYDGPVARWFREVTILLFPTARV
jgi:hypothetical protein